MIVHFAIDFVWVALIGGALAGNPSLFGSGAGAGAGAQSGSGK